MIDLSGESLISLGQAARSLPPGRRGRPVTLSCLLRWVLSALSLLVVGRLIPGFQIQGFGTALLAALVLGFLNATLGVVLAVLTFPLTLLTFGLFDFVVMAFIIWIVTAVVPGFHVTGFLPAFFGAIVLAIVSTLLRHLVAA